ncbi:MULTISPECIES: twin-arginine translocase TatA/TatE family subunit [Flavobacterium]|uniref:Sec-independent protein translocase protein TatA n=1 Tax=Flavobacterium hankyongi TaxID=1176532 RepID=A0ABP8ZNG5_9FLAO|nr:twin-arginine translocase TatA/TatE family subunit [Flavobacterium sp. N1846]
MGRLGTTEIIIILVVVLLLFGGKKIPELMKGLGSGLNEFKKASKGEDTTTAKKEDETKE